ncbi:LINE-type retrotransposon LIb DNA [Striga asiatica]|uniref:LINE-type retrotransposon LIb DNA n=1 Tax=Striga asiatica TaxID=4170 RepID=A0A5A7Q1X3_STRAF|nr:LINE-type retrotransposon LIb DNA [Striga asiatica]
MIDAPNSNSGIYIDCLLLFLRRERPDVLCLLETKADWGVGSTLARRFKFDGVYEVAASGMAGGLILLWNSLSLSATTLSCTDQSITTEISGSGFSAIITFVYVRPCSVSKDMFWDNLKLFAASVNRPWIVMGDFNDFALLSERKGGSGSCLNRVLKFRERINDCNLLDVGCEGGTFTWVWKVHGRVVVQERLDRALWGTFSRSCPNSIDESNGVRVIAAIPGKSQQMLERYPSLLNLREDNDVH